MYILEGWTQTAVAGGKKNKLLNRNYLVQRWFSLPFEHVLADHKVCAKTTAVQALKWSWGHFWQAPFFNHAMLNWNLTQPSIFFLFMAVALTTCRSPKYRKAMYWVERVNHKNRIFHQLHIFYEGSLSVLISTSVPVLSFFPVSSCF